MTESKTLALKLLDLQKCIGAATKSSENPHFRSTYADLNEVYSVAKAPLNELGVFISHEPGKDTLGTFVQTSLVDALSGQAMSAKVYFSGTEDNMQKIGAATTYAKRQGLKALLAMEEEDDDGETAVGRKENSNKTEAVKSTNSATTKHQAPTPVPAPVSKVSKKEAVLKQIALISKGLVSSGKMTQDEAVATITKYGVKSKEDLTEAQASEVLAAFETQFKK